MPADHVAHFQRRLEIILLAAIRAEALVRIDLVLAGRALHFFSWIRISVMTIWSGSRKGITGMLTRPPPSARPRPREPLLERLRPRDEPLPLPALPEDAADELCDAVEARGRRVLLDFWAVRAA
ncbi:MAG: hypothetical protein WDN69_16300 [Aliidongia sp.]